MTDTTVNRKMFRRIAEGDIFSTEQEIFYCAGSCTAVLPDGKLLVCLWYEQDGRKGVRFVILE